MKYISRYSLLVAVALCMLYFIPPITKAVFRQFSPKATVFFSPVIDDFVYSQSGKNSPTKYFDAAGNEYSRKEYTGLLPFVYTHNLVKWGAYPELIAGRYIPADEVRQNSFFYSMAPKRVDIDRSRIQLFPLFESSGEFTKVQMPDELFRIADRMEFIQGSDLNINEAKTDRFTKALIDVGFSFPAKFIGGNTSTRKPYDFGYFVIDNAGEVFHIRMFNGEPLVKNTNLPTGIPIDYITVSEDKSNPYFGFFVTTDGSVYTLAKDGYEYTRLPIEDVDITKEYVRMYSDPIYTMIKTESTDRTVARVYNKDWSLHKSFTYSKQSYYSKTFQGFYDALFPFTIKTYKAKSFRETLHLELTSHPVCAFGTSFLLAIGYVLFRLFGKKNKRMISIDGAFIFAGGIIPFIILIFLGSPRQR